MFMSIQRVVLYYLFFLYNFRRCLDIKDQQMNHEIRDKEVRLIDYNGDQLGIVPISKARAIAEERKLDLVKIAPNAKPPVCKILDIGKHKYEQAKREKENKKKQKVISLKEIRLTPRIDEHDMEVKANKASKFLKSGDKVKVTVRFRGREMGHTQIGREVLEKFAELTSEFGVVDKKPQMEGRNMIMFLVQKN